MTPVQILGAVVLGCSVLAAVGLALALRSERHGYFEYRQPRHVIELDRYRRPDRPYDWAERT